MCDEMESAARWNVFSRKIKIEFILSVYMEKWNGFLNQLENIYLNIDRGVSSGSRAID